MEVIQGDSFHNVAREDFAGQLIQSEGSIVTAKSVKVRLASALFLIGNSESNSVRKTFS